MNCYDCGLRGLQTTAIGVCVACGAAVCADCVRIGAQTIHWTEGFVSAEVSDVETRVLNCVRCSDAVHAHHPGAVGLARR